VYLEELVEEDREHDVDQHDGHQHVEHDEKRHDAWVQGSSVGIWGVCVRERGRVSLSISLSLPPP